MEKKVLIPFYKALAIAYLLLHYSAIVGAAANGGVGVGGGSNGPGQWQVLLNNTGVVAMHMALTHYNTVIMFDQTGSGPSNFRLRHRYNGRPCRVAREDLADTSCYAHSVEYNVLDNRIRPLFIEPDPSGSSGSFLSNGTLLEIGGFGSGSKRIRFYRPCKNGQCDWGQEKKHLAVGRWYASSLRLPDYNDRVVVVGGSDVSSYEFVPKRSSVERSIDLPFLRRTNDEGAGDNYNLYPILHLSPDGHLFIFANRDSILFNYKRNKVVKTFPRIPGKGSRTYPSSGSSVLLPIDHDHGFIKAEVMICGGASAGAVPAVQQGRFLRGLSSCGRMKITGNDHKWNMEQMPGARLLHDMIILPNGDILIINGAESGCAGPNNAAHPALQPYLYKPKKKLGNRFSLLKPAKIARMFHSSAILLPNGKVLVAGGNPNNNYVFHNVPHPTELRLQSFTPPKMEEEFDDRRPSNVTVQYDGGVPYGGEFSVRFLLRKKAWHTAHDIAFTAYAVPFNTHSISMNQRLLVLRCKNLTMTAAATAGERLVSAVVEAPPSATVAPAGYYMISVVNDEVPSRSQWVRFMHI